MTATPKALSRGLLTASSATLYTVPASTTTVVTNIVLSNVTGAAATATISFDGVVLIPTVSIAANTVATWDIRQPIAATKVITGLSGTASAIACHIAGAEQT